MPLDPGTRLGPYEILAILGAGGMGTVYKARDTRLDRFVAVKTVEVRYAERFKREAKAIAALNHPHICQLYDVGVDYLVMEFVDGKPLRGPIPVEDVMVYGKQIASGLEAAHRAGITHRDLKPANILLTKAGVKILDFGLARIRRAEKEAQETLSRGLTKPGQIMGTYAYMAPEQFAGTEADARTDIFAFGTVLYEMTTGKRAFQGSSRDGVQELSPPALDRIVRKCLLEDPADRWQSAQDLGEAIDLISVTRGIPAPLSKPRRSYERWIWAAMLAGVLVWALFRGEHAQPGLPTVFPVPPAEGSQFFLTPIPSPDGRMLALQQFGKETGIYLRRMDSTAMQLVADGRHFLAGWSADSRAILYRRGRRLYMKNIATSAEQPLSDFESASMPEWHRTGGLVFIKSGAVQHLAGPDRQPVAITAGPGHTAPQILSDGKRVLYRSTADNGWFVKALDAGVKEKGRGPLTLPADGRLVIGVVPYWFYLEEGRLVARRFDEKELVLEGPTTVLLESATAWAASATVVVTSARNSSREASWFDRQGNLLESVGRQSFGFGGALSPDGKRFVFPASSNSDLWIADLTRKTVSRFTFASKFGMVQPVWSPDGDSVVYGSSGALWRKPSSGAGSEIEILRGGSGGNLYPTDWSGDGRILLYYDYGSSFDVLALPMTEASAKPVPLETGPFSEYGARLSPDGRWMSYVSDESGRYEIYVRDFSGQSKAKGKWLLTNDGGSWHRWRPDGREILYVNNARLISVDVDGTRDAFVAGTPKELFRTSPTTYIAGVSKDGQRILMIHSSQYAAEPVTVLLNWESRISRRAE